ncbi:NRAMP family divalent metal transporter [Actinomycetospora chibensis]|uniref:NRAMP family divalent metal transporter n=1 Tax=Actinomycetospora chibensis TaxID=663606 RepID=A0ABV9RN90_9PSEU|nr:divalent metal cation transporter [Actinomycetospora chibensis]MDD7922261.1 divalent metal cation transporter [Actinomycetospora chibensis]
MAATGDQAPAGAVRAGRRTRLLALVAVLGPGLLAGLSDDDPAGITTYSVLGAQYGYQLLWVLLLSTLALIVFHSLGARMGVVTGQGLIGLIRQRYGVRAGGIALVVLVVANVGTTCAEFAGIAGGFELFGVSRYVAVPVAAVAVTVLMNRGNFHRVEHILIGLSAVFVAYVAAGILAGPDWGQAFYGLVVPTMPLTRDAVLIATATVGTTLAPWGLSFIQSYAVDKKLTVADLRYERIDVATGAVLTGVIGFFVVVACAATLHVQGVAINDAADAAGALEPLAGSLASALFAIGLIGAALLAAAVLPLSTAYSICEYTGSEAALDDRFADAKPFYLSYVVVIGVSALIVLLPDAPLIPILVLSQVLNAVLLLPLLVFMYGIARDRDLMGDHTASRPAAALYLATIAFIALCVGALFVLNVA